MNIRILITLLFGVTLFCSCQPKQLPVNSLAERVTEGTSKDRILFRMTPEKDDVSKDYFEITAEDGKVLIVGNSDLSLATGLNWYLKYVAGIHLSWNNPSQKLPEVLPLPIIVLIPTQWLSGIGNVGRRRLTGWHCMALICL